VVTIRERFLRIRPSLLTNFHKLVISGSEGMRRLVLVALLPIAYSLGLAGINTRKRIRAHGSCGENGKLDVLQSEAGCSHTDIQELYESQILRYARRSSLHFEQVFFIVFRPSQSQLTNPFLDDSHSLTNAT
jgi:hypothetical protein